MCEITSYLDIVLASFLVFLGNVLHCLTTSIGGHTLRSRGLRFRSPAVKICRSLILQADEGLDEPELIHGELIYGVVILVQVVSDNVPWAVTPTINSLVNSCR